MRGLSVEASRLLLREEPSCAYCEAIPVRELFLGRRRYRFLGDLRSSDREADASEQSSYLGFLQGFVGGDTLQRLLALQKVWGGLKNQAGKGEEGHVSVRRRLARFSCCV